MPIQINTSVKGKEYDRHEVPEIDIERWAENQKAEKVVTGRATVTLPSRG